MEHQQRKSLKSSYFSRGVVIWFLAAFFFFFDQLLNVSPTAMRLELAETFALKPSHLGILAACYAWPYAFMQIPAGIMMDRIGPRKLLSFASILCAIGSLLSGVAPSLMYYGLGRFFIGTGASFAVVGCSKLAAAWFDDEKFALFVGLMTSVGMLGGVFGLGALNKLLIYADWRQLMNLAAGIALGLAALMWLVIRNKPSEAGYGHACTKVNELNASKQTDLTEEQSVWQQIKAILTSAQDWYASVFGALMYLPTMVFGALWGIPFLTEAYGLSNQQASNAASMVFVGWIFGGPLYGWVSAKLGKRNPPMWFAAISTITILLLLIYHTSFKLWEINLLFFALGLCSCGFIIAYAVVKEINPESRAATAIGCINTVNNLGTAIFQPLIGYFLDYLTGGKVAASLQDYQNALVIIPVLIAGSLVFLWLLRETNCRNQQS